LGEQGAVIANQQQQCEHIQLDQTSTVCDSTGAGDSFVGTLALLMAQREHMPLKEQVRRACRVASQSVEHRGTQTSYPNRDELRFSLFDWTHLLFVRQWTIIDLLLIVTLISFHTFFFIRRSMIYLELHWFID
jgi:hypothetical protein